MEMKSVGLNEGRMLYKTKKKQNQTEKGATYDVGSKSIAKL